MSKVAPIGSESGFSLIEALVTLAVAGALTVIMGGFLLNMQRTVAKTENSFADRRGEYYSERQLRHLMAGIVALDKADKKPFEGSRYRIRAASMSGPLGEILPTDFTLYIGQGRQQDGLHLEMGQHEILFDPERFGRPGFSFLDIDGKRFSLWPHDAARSVLPSAVIVEFTGRNGPDAIVMALGGERIHRGG